MPTDECLEEEWDVTLSPPEEGHQRGLKAEVRNLARYLEHTSPKKYRVVFEPRAESLRLEVSEKRAQEPYTDLEREFRRLAEQWEDETEHISNLNKAIAHPAYQQIIGMGKAVPTQIVPLLLRHLEESRDHWLVALHEITKEDPAQDDANFEEAVQAWLNWGRKRGHLTEARA
jgi:predicted RNase H-like nuclease (RuvC/YqgF family)